MLIVDFPISKFTKKISIAGVTYIIPANNRTVPFDDPGSPFEVVYCQLDENGNEFNHIVLGVTALPMSQNTLTIQRIDPPVPEKPKVSEKPKASKGTTIPLSDFPVETKSWPKDL